MTSRNSSGLVVTYKPTEAHLGNLRKLSKQVDTLVVIDNGSSCECLQSLIALQAELRFDLIQNSENMGIAFALNQGVQLSISKGCRWINLFDQDSCITEGYITSMIEEFELLSENMNLGLLVPIYRDPANNEDAPYDYGDKAGPFVTMTSGSLFRADVLQVCGRFEDELFIYIVDDEYSLRLRHRGFEIGQSKTAVLMHAAGEPKKVRIFKRELFAVTNHSAPARYYLHRNRIWLSRRYFRVFPKFCASLFVCSIKEALKIAFAEDQKWLKLKRIAQGIRDGLLGRMGHAALS